MSTVHPVDALSITLVGLDAHVVHIHAAVGGPARFQILGLSEAQVRETRVRVQSALHHVGVDVHPFDLTVRITPVELHKTAALDLPIAVAVLGAIGRVSLETLTKTVMLGELSLTGAVRPVRGVLPALRGSLALGITSAIVPKDNAQEAANVSGIRVFVAKDLDDVVRHLNEGDALNRVKGPPTFSPSPPSADMVDIRGMLGARRALELAAVGGHNLLLVGHPGAGKTMLARRLAGILPPLTEEEAVEVTAIHSVAGLLSPGVGIIGTRPFRAPHHTVSAAGLVGGGDPVRPGEVSIAHGGVLFLDELLEFRGPVLEALLQTLEQGATLLGRTGHRAAFPAKPLVVAATSPCPCGLLGDRSSRCSCSPERVERYFARTNRRLFDHFDVRVVLPALDMAGLRDAAPVEATSAIQGRVVAARALQARRFRDGDGARTNAQFTTTDVARFAVPDSAGAKLMAQAVDRLGLTVQDYRRVLRLARTVSDLDGSEAVRPAHLAEAIQSANLPSRLVLASGL